LAPADKDGDGIPVTADCDDNNANVRPGAQDIPGNGIDEDCTGGDATFPKLTAEVGLTSAAFPAFTKVLRLRVTSLTGGETVLVTCKLPKGKKTRKKSGCPFTRKSQKAKLAELRFDSAFKDFKLPAGTTLEVTVTRSGSIGRFFSAVMRNRKAPKTTKKFC